MNDAERHSLSAIRDRWITGGTAATLAPPEWQQMIEGAGVVERERLLLAIAGQAFDVALQPAAPTRLTMRPPLPVLALPSVPERLRPLFRSALKVAHATRSRRRVVLVAEARGFVANPMDWMPAASDVDAPRAYAPWIDWRTKASATQQPVTTLNADSWDDFLPAERRNALTDLRGTDPEAARRLLEARAAGESAEARLLLLGVLQLNLSAADAPYLQALAADRSNKVRHLAARLLARIGHDPATEEGQAEVRELADFIDVTKTGILRRVTTYVPKALKSQAQIRRRDELFAVVQLRDLAVALGTTERDLAAGWEPGADDDADSGFARMVAESGSEEAVRMLGARLIAAGNAVLLGVLLPRLDQAARRSLVATVLSGQGEQAGALDLVPDSEVCSFDRDDLMTSPLYRGQRAAIASGADALRTAEVLGFFGCLATPAAAAAMIADLTTAGIGPGDPALALLRLNAALAGY